MKKNLISTLILVCLITTLQSQTKYDTILNIVAKTTVTIDAKADEPCWANAEWHPINQVWIPFGATMKTGDFEGKFKVAWDAQYLYVLVEVVDDSLSDDRTNPLDGWWDDDCLEIFIDENRSMGNHECTNNAFAYHVSIFYDAIDLSTSCQGINYKNHVIVKMDTIAENTYLWEMAFKIYSDKYSNSNPEASRVTLSPNKLMGLTVAYCDNDETKSRENFIGSMKMTAATYNDMYKNANYFGPMMLKDPDYVGINYQMNSQSIAINLYPMPAKNQVTVELVTDSNSKNKAFIYASTGQLLITESFIENSHTIDLSKLDAGLYVIKIETAAGLSSKIFVKE